MMTPTTSAIEFRRVSRVFGEGALAVTALDDVSFRVPAGGVFGVLGESGAGKSTLLRLMNGLDHPTSGSVLVEGIDLATLSKREMNGIRHRIGVIFQSFNLVGNLTVRQNVALPLALQRRKQPEKVAELIDFVGLGHRIDHHPAQLSGGEKQRVAIARALVIDPSLILCDEPTSALDTHTTAEILALLGRTRREFGTSVVLVTHELDAVKAVCDTAAVFESGRLRDVVEVRATSATTGRNYVDHVRAVLGA
ncbi:ATP-binding cassette domain-containing protein [Leucobacter zeae]|nr:ATP-binding cassette domain-containing protein [Leucobacter zeae]